MLHWLVNDIKMTSERNFNLRFCEILLAVARDILVQFGVIWEVSWSGVIIKLQMGILKEGMLHWLGNDKNITALRNFKLKFSGTSLDLVWGFWFPFEVIWEVWLPGVIIYLKICLKEGLSHLLSNDRKMTLHRHLKQNLSKKPLDLDRGF